MSITGSPDGEPQKVGVALVDMLAGLFASVGILAALRHRDATGEGQRVEVNLLSALLAGLVNQGSAYTIAGVVPSRMGNAHPSISPYELYPTGDGELVVAVGNERQFAALCQVIGRARAGRRPPLWLELRPRRQPRRVQGRAHHPPGVRTRGGVGDEADRGARARGRGQRHGGRVRARSVTGAGAGGRRSRRAMDRRWRSRVTRSGSRERLRRTAPHRRRYPSLKLSSRPRPARRSDRRSGRPRAAARSRTAGLSVGIPAGLAERRAGGVGDAVLDVVAHLTPADVLEPRRDLAAAVQDLRRSRLVDAIGDRDDRVLRVHRELRLDVPSFGGGAKRPDQGGAADLSAHGLPPGRSATPGREPSN